MSLTHSLAQAKARHASFVCARVSHDYTCAQKGKDRTCQACRAKCPAGQFEAQKCSAASDRVCKPCSPKCSVGQHELVGCTATSNRKCEVCGPDHSFQCDGVKKHKIKAGFYGAGE